jgi:DNA-binding NarL/FixJ family response regulator
MSVRVLLADDHKMMRQALRALLDRENDIAVVAEAGNGAEVVSMAREFAPDIVVMDIGMPGLNGFEATKQLLACQPGVKVIALSAYSDKRFVQGMLEAGAVGYVIKSAAGEELTRAIRTVRADQSYFCPEIAAVLAEALRDSGKTRVEALGRREKAVLKLLAEGVRSSEIAERLNIAPATVEVHRRNIMRKLDLHTVAELTKYAIREGLTSV